MTPLLRDVLLRSVEHYQWDLTEENSDGTIVALIDLSERLDTFGVEGVPKDPKELQEKLVQFNYGEMFAVAQVNARRHLQMLPCVNFKEALNKYFEVSGL